MTASSGASAEGARAPSLVHVPPGRVGSFVDDVGEVAERIGRPLDPHQVVAVDALTAHDRRGRFLSIEAGVEGPRQTVGKTGGILLPVFLWTALSDPDPDLMTWSAHLIDTSNKAFFELVGKTEDDPAGLFQQHAWLRRRVRSVSRENGAEGISFTNGAEWAFRARSARRGRGLSGSTVGVDEALFATAEEMGAVLPTLATRSAHGNARAYYASSAAKRESRFLRSLRRRALAGDPSLTFVAWWSLAGSWAGLPCARGADCSHEVGTAGCALDDESLWLAANPGVPDRVSLEFLWAMRRSLTPVEFGREFMGLQEDGDDAVDVSKWSALADKASEAQPAPAGLMFDVRPGLRGAAVAVAGYRADGVVHVELRHVQVGVAGLVELLKAETALHGVPVRHAGGRSAPVAALIPELQKAGVPTEPIPEAEMPAACGAFERLVEERGLRHLGDVNLANAFGVAVRRDVGDGAWVLTRKGSSGDISPAVAAVGAVWDLLSRQPEPVEEAWVLRT